MGIGTLLWSFLIQIKFTESAVELIIPGESLLGIVDIQTYASFIDSNWTLEQFNSHIQSQGRLGRIVCWGTGASANWIVDVQTAATKTKGVREFSASIQASSSALHLVSYDMLTYAAQFRSIRLPRSDAEDWRIAVSPGCYKIRVIQLFDSALADSESVFTQSAPHYRVVLKSIKKAKFQAQDSLFWFPDFLRDSD